MDETVYLRVGPYWFERGLYGDFTLRLFLSLSSRVHKNHHDAISVVVVASPKCLAQLVAMIQPMVMLPYMHNSNAQDRGPYYAH